MQDGAQADPHPTAEGGVMRTLAAIDGHGHSHTRLRSSAVDACGVRVVDPRLLPPAYSASETPHGISMIFAFRSGLKLHRLPTDVRIRSGRSPAFACVRPTPPPQTPRTKTN